jgi:hypothetical protein
LVQQTYAPHPAKGRLALAGLVIWAMGFLSFGPPLIRQALDTSGDAPATSSKGVSFRNETDGFSVTLPSQPERTVDSASDGSLVVYNASVGRGSLLIVASDWPGDAPVSPAEGLHQFVTTWAKAEGKLVSTAEITVQGRTALDVLVDTPKGRMFGRVMYVDGPQPRLFLLQTTNGPSSALKAAYDRMIATFRLDG